MLGGWRTDRSDIDVLVVVTLRLRDVIRSGRPDDQNV
jgi:hypothetical protein